VSVVFELPDSHPEISRIDAIKLAGLLERRRTVSAFTTASKLRHHVRSGKRRDRLELQPAESVALFALLDDEPTATDNEAVAHLHARLRLMLLPS
jgi:hypothetical protein